MKTNLLLRARKTGMGFLYVLWGFIKFLWWVFPKLIILGLILTPPVLGFIYLSHFLGTVLGIIVSAYFTFLVSRSVKAVRLGKTRGLLVVIMDAIMVGGYAGLGMSVVAYVIFVISGGLLNIPKGEPIWPGLIVLYFMLVLLGLVFGFFIVFAEESFFKGIDEYESDMKAQNEDWKEKKRKMILFNPIILPFSLVGLPTYEVFKLILEMIKIMGIAVKESYLEGAERIKTKTPQ